MTFGQSFEMLVRVLDHHDGRVDHRADGNRNAAQAHEVGAHAQQPHGDEGDQYAHRQHQDGDQRAAHMHQEDDADQRDNEGLLNQSALEGGNRAVDQLGTVVDRLYRDAGRQTGSDLRDLLLQVGNHFKRVLTIPRHGDAGHHFTFAVEFGEAAPFVRRQFHPCDVADQHGRALVALDDQHFDIRLAAQVAHATHHVFGLGHLHGAPADVAVGVPDRLGHFHQRNAKGAQLDRIDRDLVGLHEAADRCHLGHPVRLGQLVADIPVLNGTQFGQRLVFRQ
jgi:hypothetical protein